MHWPREEGRVHSLCRDDLINREAIELDALPQSLSRPYLHSAAVQRVDARGMEELDPEVRTDRDRAQRRSQAVARVRDSTREERDLSWRVAAHFHR